MNNLSIIGNLTADPVTRTVGQSTVTDFSIAVNEVYYKDEKKVENVHFFNCTAWGARGENIAKYFTKGQKIALTGSLGQDRWEKDGEKRSVVKIKVEGFDFCGDKKPQEGSQSERQPSRAERPKDPDLDAPEDDIPFS